MQLAMIKLGLALDRWLDHAYRPDQPRVPAGRPDGGQWTDGDGVATPKFPAARPTVTVHSNTRITIHYPDGSAQTRIDGSRSWRNHNPGNIITGTFANTHGAIGNNHGFAVFPREATGHTASMALLKTRSYRNLTVDAAIYQRSPPPENDTPRLQEAIRKIGGFTGNEILRDLNDAQLQRLLEAIMRMEGWRTGTIIDTPPR